ncbi:MAG: hypothetical protein PVI79_04995 [Gammaproteobacteria bacterium]
MNKDKADTSINLDSHPLFGRIALGCATVFLVAGLLYSYISQPQVLNELVLWPVMLLILIGVPLTLCLNAVEFGILARLGRVEVTMLKALEITLLGSAANLLPLPGSTMVRVAALKAAGAPLLKGTSSTIVVGVIWISVAFGYSGTWMLVTASGLIAYLFLAIGALVLLGCLIWWRLLDGGYFLLLWVLVTRLMLVIVDSARLFLCFAALGVDASFAQASGLAVAGVLGSAVSIVPAGLGVREGVAAAISPIVGLAASFGFLSAFLNRLAGLVVIAPLAAMLSLRTSRSKVDQGQF